MRVQLAFVPFGLMALLLISCAGDGSFPRQENDTPTFGAYPYGSSDVRRQQYGPPDRAGNQMQNGLPPYSGCQYTARC
jgi:hypothetical protein